MEYRRARKDDYSKIILLQEILSDKNVTDKKEGFLISNFDEKQLDEINNNGLIFVAYDDEKDNLAAFAIIRPVAYYYKKRIPMIQSFLDGLKEKIDIERTCVVGPVCTALEYRKQGIRTNLFMSVLEEISSKYDMSVGFIDYENEASAKANIKGNAKHVGSFKSNNKKYYFVMTPLNELGNLSFEGYFHPEKVISSKL